VRGAVGAAGGAAALLVRVLVFIFFLFTLMAATTVGPVVVVVFVFVWRDRLIGKSPVKVLNGLSLWSKWCLRFARGTWYELAWAAVE